MLCERCGNNIYKYSVCDYCHRKICYSCVKSSRRANKTTRLVICKDDWSKMPVRKMFKSTAIARA